MFCKKMLRNIFCFLVVTAVTSTIINAAPRIGIVGAGIGGTSAAYFLKELFGEDAQIDIFEKGTVSGRLVPVKIGEHEYNAGGTIIHPQNMYMVNFTKMLGLQQNTKAESGKLGIYDGKELLFTTSDWSLVTLAKLFWRYGWDIYKISSWVQDKVLKPIVRFYDVQRDGHAFSTVEDLIAAMDKSLVGWSKKSIGTLMKEEGFSDRFINEFVEGAMQVNYGQTIDVQALVGAVSMAGVEPGLWNVVGGNHLVPEGLLAKSGANLIEAEVKMITLLPDERPSYTVAYNKIGSEESEEKDYDIVIMATPFYKRMSKIQFDNFPKDITPIDNDFHLTVATFMEGAPNISYFGCDNMQDFPSAILVCDKDFILNSFAFQKPVDQSTSKVPVYRSFSNKVPTERQLKQFITKWDDLRMINWMAYPEYGSSVELPPFLLYEQLYHINAIEMAGSAMEMSVVGAKNVALLAYYNWNGQYDKIDEFLDSESTQTKTEL